MLTAEMTAERCLHILLVVVVVVVVVLVDFNFVASLFPMLGKNDFATDERSAVSVCQ